MSVKVSDENKARMAEIVRMRVSGMTYAEIGAAVGLSMQRIAAIVRQALATGDYVASVTVHDVKGAPLPDLADYLRHALNQAGIQTTRQHKEQTQ